MSVRTPALLVLATACALAFGCGDSDGGGGDDGGTADGGGGGTGGGGGFACGMGTIEQGGECVSDPGLRIDCGEGTFEFNGECVAYDPNDETAPETTAEPMGGRYLVLPAKVTLTTNEPAKIYYTTDGSAPDTSSDFQPSPAVIAPITDGMEIRFFAEDPAGNAEDPQSETYELAPTPPSPVTDLAVAMSGNDATLSWTTPDDADGVLIVQLGTDMPATPTAGESYEVDDMLGSGTVVFVGSADEFDAADLPVGVTSWLVYTYNDVLLYSGGVLARSGEVALPTQDGVLTVDVMDTSASVGTNPSDLTVTAGNVVYDGIGGTVSVDVTVENESSRPIYLPKMLVSDAALSGGGSATLDNSQGDYPVTAGKVTGTVNVTTLTLPGDVNAATLNLYAGNGIQNLNFADPLFTGTTPASLIKYINDHSTGLVASLDGTNHVVITNLPPGSTEYTYVSNSGVGTTLGFDGISNYGTDLPFIYLCPADPEANDDSLIEDNTLCMRALRPGESVTKTLLFGGVVSDSVVTVDFEITGNRLAIGGDGWDYFNTSYALHSHVPLFDTRANLGVGFLANDPLAIGPNGYWRTSAFVLAPDGHHAFVGSRVSLRMSVYDLRTSRVVGGADLESGFGHVADMTLANDGYLYALLNVNHHEYRWSSYHSLKPSEMVVLRLDPNTLEELARAHVVVPRPEYSVPATHTTSIAISGLVLPTAVTGGTLEVSVNGEDPQTIDFASPTFTGTTGAALATFLNANSTGLAVTFDSMLDRLVIESEGSGKDASFQFSATAAQATLGIGTSLYEGDETATFIQNSSSDAPRAKRMDISPDASMLAFGVVQDAASIQGVDLYTGEVYFVDLGTMTFVDQDDVEDGVQPVYLQGAIDPDDTGLDYAIVNPATVAFSPDGTTLFATGDDQVGGDPEFDVDAIAMIDVASGDVTYKEIPDNDVGKTLWRRPDGGMWLMCWSYLYDLDPDSGDMTLISDSVNDYNAFTPSTDGNYFAKDYYDGMAEIAPDGTELYWVQALCKSTVGALSCNDPNVYNYGKSVISTPY